jgi:hypothetical protein
MNEQGVLLAYMGLIEDDLTLEGRATVSPEEDKQAVGTVAGADMREKLAAIYRARGYSVEIVQESGALVIRRH